MGRPERHLHQEGHTHPESLLDVDLESSTSLGSHHGMPADCLPRQLLVCAPAHSGRSAGGRSCGGMTRC